MRIPGFVAYMVLFYSSTMKGKVPPRPVSTLMFCFSILPLNSVGANSLPLMHISSILLQEETKA